MTDDLLFESRLRRQFDDLASDRPGDGQLEVVLERTQAIRPRPAWRFPERWIPALARPPFASDAALWLRPAVVLALLALAVMIGAILLAGRTDRHLPQPYGPAGNGLVAFSYAGNDIYLGDPRTGAIHAIASGTDIDAYPGFSRDGSKILFLRRGPSDPEFSGQLMLADVDGSGLRSLTGARFVEITGGDWSGDGRWIVLTSKVNGQQAMTVIDVDAGEQRALDVDMAVDWVLFRPGTTSELLFADVDGHGIFRVMLDGSNMQRVIGPSDGLQQPTWSPDGQQLAFSQYDAATGNVFTHIVDADGGHDRVLDSPAGVIYQILPQWSPDARFLLVGRGYWHGTPVAPSGTTPDRFSLAVLSVDGSAPDRDFSLDDFSFTSGWAWSPDGTKVVTSAETGYTIVDLATGDIRTRPGWFAADWQRVAP